MLRTWRGRWVVLPFAVALGAIAAALATSNGEFGFAVFAFMLLTLFGAYVGFSRSEWAIMQTGEGDERQRAVNVEAMQYAYYAVVLVTVTGFFFELAADDPGPFTLVGAVGGFTHMGALALLGRRR